MLRVIESILGDVADDIYELQENIKHLQFTVVLLALMVIIQMVILMCIYTCIQ